MGNHPKYVIDMHGKRFGKWIVISFIGKQRWECMCECGTIANLHGMSLRGGTTTQCRKCRGKERRTPIEINKKIGKWTVLEEIHDGQMVKWVCKCECGTISNQNSDNLLSGKSSSCHPCSAKSKLPYGQAAFNDILGEYKRNAKKRNIEWALSDNEFKELINSNCYYTGLPPATIKKAGGGDYVYNGIDRIDSTKCYFLDNCVPCNGKVNVMKMSMPISEFIEICALITKNMSIKNKEIINQNKLKAV